MTAQTLARLAPREIASQPIIERFLRDRREIWRQVAHSRDLPLLARQMVTTALLGLACYGAVIGLSHSPLQALVSAVKLPILFLLTLVICLPTFYFFNLLLGGRLSAWQTLALALSALTMPAVLTLAFVPVTIFFLVTMQNYFFSVMLNICILALTSLVGLYVLFEGAYHLNRHARQEEGSQGQMAGVNLLLLPFWLSLFGFVGTQLAWTLRPFFGDPTQPFALFRPIEGNFYLALWHMFWALLY